jgi:hypothetical protein
MYVILIDKTSVQTKSDMNLGTPTYDIDCTRIIYEQNTQDWHGLGLVTSFIVLYSRIA